MILKVISHFYIIKLIVRREKLLNNEDTKIFKKSLFIDNNIFSTFSSTIKSALGLRVASIEVDDSIFHNGQNIVQGYNDKTQHQNISKHRYYFFFHTNIYILKCKVNW